MPDRPYQIKSLGDDIIEVTLKPHVDLDVSMTDAIDQELHRIGPDRKFFQLVIASGPYMVEPEMRNSMSQGDTGIKQHAIAWISPDEKANAEQEAIVSTLPIPVPIRFFSDREKGLAWLRKLAAEYRAKG